MQRLLLALSLTPVFSDYIDEIASCESRHLPILCASCFTQNHAESCDYLVDECQQLGGSQPACLGCYNDKNYAQCALIDAAAGGDSDDAAASIAACTASLTAADALLAKAAEVCPEVQLVGDVYSVGPLNCDRIHSVYQNNQCCGTC